MLIHKERREGNKFEAVAEPGVHLGFSDVHSAYKIYMLGSRKFKIARDIRFYEDIFPFRGNPVTDLSRMNPEDAPYEVKDRSDEFDPLGISLSRSEMSKLSNELYSSDRRMWSQRITKPFKRGGCEIRSKFRQLDTND